MSLEVLISLRAGTNVKMRWLFAAGTETRSGAA
jgi:hypothetical protein